MRLGIGAGCEVKSPMNSLMIGVVVVPSGRHAPPVTRTGVRRATLTHGFVMNTNDSPAYNFPSDSALSLPELVARAKLECFLHHGSSPRRRGWFANKSLQATRDGALSSASRFTLVGPACLSSGR